MKTDLTEMTKGHPKQHIVVCCIISTWHAIQRVPYVTEEMFYTVSTRPGLLTKPQAREMLRQFKAFEIIKEEDGRLIATPPMDEGTHAMKFDVAAIVNAQ